MRKEEDCRQRRRTVDRGDRSLADGVRFQPPSWGSSVARARSSICCSEQAFGLGQLRNALKRIEEITARLPQGRVEECRFAPDERSLSADPEHALWFIFRGDLAERRSRFWGAVKFPPPSPDRRSGLILVHSNSGHVIVCVRRDWWLTAHCYGVRCERRSGGRPTPGT